MHVWGSGPTMMANYHLERPVMRNPLEIGTLGEPLTPARLRDPLRLSGLGDRMPRRLAAKASARTPILSSAMRIIAGEAQLRSYLRRALLEATPAGRALFATITDLVVRQLERYGDARAMPNGSPLAWLAVEVVAVDLAGVVFEPMLARTLGKKPFARDVVAWRTEANRRFIVAALREYVPSRRDPWPTR